MWLFRNIIFITLLVNILFLLYGDFLIPKGVGQNTISITNNSDTRSDINSLNSIIDTKQYNDECINHNNKQESLLSRHGLNLSDFNFVAAGDWGNGVNAQNTINNMKLSNPELVFGLGDYAYETISGGIDSWWNRFISADLSQKWYGALGNHDNDMIPSGDKNNYQKKFPNQNTWYFSFNYQNIHFLVVDTESIYTMGSPQYNFIKNDLSTANSNSSIKWKVVILHKDMYASEGGHSPLDSLRDVLHPLFDQFKVDLVIQGHNHNYQRMFPLKYAGMLAGDNPIITTTNKTNYKNPEGQIYLVVGTGGQGLSTLSTSKPYIVTQFQDFGHLNIDVLENGTKFMAKFINNTGIIKDVFTITKPNLRSYQSTEYYKYEPSKYFSGENYTDISASTQSLQLNHFTIAVWIKTTCSSNITYIVNKGGIGSDKPGFNMNYGIWLTSEKLRGGFETIDGKDIFVKSPNRYTDGKWHHVLLSYDGYLLQLYVDGNYISSIKTNGAIPDNTGDQPLRVGANSLEKNKFFTGNIDEIRLWDRALTPTEVKKTYDNNISEEGLILSNDFGDAIIRNDVGIDVGAFYYPWYGKYKHWTDNGHNPPITWASNYLPSLFDSQYPNLISDNLYNSNDSKIIKKQIQLMNEIGIEFGIVSWWGQNSYEDMVFNKIINEVHPTIDESEYDKFKWAILYEDEGYGNPTLIEIVNDLNYIKHKYASSPYYLHVNGKPVIFVYNTSHNGSDPIGEVERWKEAKKQIPFYVVFKVDPLALGANPGDMDSWYQYAPSKYFEQQKTFSAFVSPGFWKYHENVRLPANTTEFENAVIKLKQAPVTWKLIETWNEWGEGTGIEPAQQIIHDDINGFKLAPNLQSSQQYIDIFKRYFK